MPNLVLLQYLIDYHSLKRGSVLPQLQLSAEFREAVGACKIGRTWHVDQDLVPDFKPSDWNSYGERRVEVDSRIYTKVSSLDASDERNRKIRYLFSVSKAVRRALGATVFSGIVAHYAENKRLQGV